MPVLVDDYLNKVIQLQRQLGAKTGYQQLEPFQIWNLDCVGINDAARRIARFVGLEDLVFIVAVTPQGKNVAGHIELTPGQREVFIEISDATAEFEDAVLATLAHEITHKYMDRYRVSCGSSEYENEILTDITSVFLGLGKLMLNGCDCRRMRFVTGNGSSDAKQIEETLRMGYLDQSQFAFVYLLVCIMRRVPPAEFERGLTGSAKQALQRCYQSFTALFDPSYHAMDIANGLGERLQSLTREARAVLSCLEGIQNSTQELLLYPVERLRRNTGERLEKMLAESRSITEDEAYDPSLRYLTALQLDRCTDCWLAEIRDHREQAIQQASSQLTRLVTALKDQGVKLPADPPCTPSRDGASALGRLLGKIGAR